MFIEVNAKEGFNIEMLFEVLVAALPKPKAMPVATRLEGSLASESRARTCNCS